MDGKDKVLEIIKRGQKRQWLCYSVVFGFGAIFGLSTASFGYVFHQNKELSAEVNELKANMKRVNQTINAEDLTLPPQLSF